MTTTPRLAMPLLAPGQAQKELFHNEALQLLDFAVAATVQEPPLSTPPAAPLLGSCYIVGPGAVGAWSGHDAAIAGYGSGGWRFLEPPEGMSVHVRSRGTTALFSGGTWTIGTIAGERLVIDGNQVVSARGVAIATPSGGSTVDGEARAAIGDILAALRQHGLIAT